MLLQELGGKKIIDYVTANAAQVVAPADTYVVVLALTDMMRGVGVGIDALQRATPIISGFLLGYVAVLPLVGRLSDLVDRQRVLLGCLAVFVAGSAVTALAVELPVLEVEEVSSTPRMPRTACSMGRLTRSLTICGDAPR